MKYLIVLTLIGTQFLLKSSDYERGSLHFPEIEYPAGNSPTDARITLGEKLFFDPILSRDYSISCSSCHLVDNAFSDSVSFSSGVGGAKGDSNAPSLLNVAYAPYMNRDGGVPTIEMQVLVPVQEHKELDNNIVLIAERLKNIEEYVSMSKEAYDREPDPYVITRALAAYERTLISDKSKFDAYDNFNASLSEEELRGMNLFYSSKTSCSSCHSGFNFTNYSFQNNGLYQQYADSGRMRITKKEADRALFKVPSLRNIELTAPYMHDGSLSTLEEVLEHYGSGINTHPNLSEVLLEPLTLTSDEQSAIIAFLKTLTDERLKQ